MKAVNIELTQYDSALAQKEQLVVINKIDLPGVRAEVDRIKADFAEAGIKVLFASAATGEGVKGLMAEAMGVLSQLTRKEAEGQPPLKVFRPRPRTARPAVHKEGDTFVVAAPGLDRLITREAETGSGVPRQLRQQFDRRGITKALIRAGIKTGDRVRCGEREWEWA
jgi:GTP-binding protein